MRKPVCCTKNPAEAGLTFFVSFRLSRRLFLSVFLGVGLSCLFGVISGLAAVAACGVSVMGSFLVLSTFVVLGRFPMMAGRMRMMFRRFLVMFGCFLRHTAFL
jgi:hypothetical protein